MLVLSRKKSEKIVIEPPGQEPIVLTIVDVERGKVRVGIEADKKIIVNRLEVKLKKDKERLDQVAV